MRDLTWWGLRIRLPDDYDPAPLNRYELGVVFGNLAAWLQCGWLCWLILRIGPNQTPNDFLRHDVIVPLVLTVGALAAALLVPPSWMEHTWVGARLIYARESGRLRRIDRVIVLFALAAAGFVLWKRTLAHWPAISILFGTIALISWVLGFMQQHVLFDPRPKTIQLPKWLRDIGRVTEENGIVQAEAGARKAYAFRAGEVVHHVGVRIEDELLASLREVNARFEGRLFHDQALAVILADREPVLRIGKDELLRLSAQVGTIGERQQFTRYEFANAVLAFVQEQIRYAFDEESTGQFAGGPFPEYGRFALETLNDGVGDCDCTAILTATVLAHIGFDTALVFLSFRDPESDVLCHHAAVGLASDDLFLAAGNPFDAFTFSGQGEDRRRYLYGETAVEGTTLAFGTVPAEWQKTLDIYKVVAIPGCKTA